MDAALRILTRAVRVHVPVVLEGETGTGKSLAARWIHLRGDRRDGPFIPVNCAGIPDGLFESELFGHRRGAFTGATEDREGLFEAASGGTLFLDEVAELPQAQQGKLLTVLEARRVRRVGEGRFRPVDVRVLAATSRELDREVRDGTFRADLFHRLAVLRCSLPPLRARGEDVILLAERFLDDLGHRHLGRPARLTPAGASVLRSYPWPGNVRELAHALEASVILAGRALLDRAHLEEVLGSVPVPGVHPADVDAEWPGRRGRPAAPDRGGRERERTEGAGPLGGTRVGGRYSFYGTPAEEREIIRSSLERFRGNRTRTARHLGMSRSTLRARIRKYQL
jgi:DNA-binding NtrC family response regulator